MRLSLTTLVLAALLCPPPAAAQPAVDALARRLLNSQGCKACHRFEGEGGSFAPDLSTVGARLERGQIATLLTNARHRHAAGRVGDFSHLRSEEFDALVTFLSRRR